MNEFDNISQMEEKFDRHNDLLKKVNELLDEFEKGQSDYQELRDYYYSEKFQEDFEKSNKGELPEDLKCGVLSEDAIFNIIVDNYQTAIHMLELATSIIKEN